MASMIPILNKSNERLEGMDSSASTPEFAGVSDEDVWKAFKEGDEGAFIYLYRNYANLLFNFGVKFSKDRELVEDCLQDFFLYLRTNRHRLSNTDSIKLYLLKSFRRRVIEYVTKLENQMKNNRGLLEFELNLELSDETKFINKQIHEEHLTKLKAALDRLDNKEREAIYYFYYEGLGYAEIAEILEMTHVSSARRIIYRALSHLKDFFVLLIVSAAQLF